eukprot:31143-Pelagococcus_subviridis.AAC.9
MPLLFFLLALVLAPAKALAVGAAAVAARASRDGALCFASSARDARAASPDATPPCAEMRALLDA